MNWTWAYLAVLYALAIALARRRVEIPWRVAMAGYALVLIFLFRPLTGPTINFAADMIGLIPPWSSEVNVTKFTVSNAGIHDATMQVIPWGQQVRTMWREGTVPLWNALAGCGYPLLANGQSAALFPLRLLALPLPSPYWIAGEAAMKLLVAFTFMFLYLRGRGSSEIASVGGAIAFSLSTYVIVWLHFAIANVAVFTPAIFLAIDRLSSGVSARRIAFAAIVSAFMVFGGHLETVVYIALMTLLYVAWIVVGERIERRGQFLGALVVALVAAFLLAAPFLAPFAEAVTRSQRWSEAARIQFRGVPFSDLPSLVVFLQPRFFGGPRLPWGPMSCETITGFAGILGIAGAAAALFHAASQKQWRDRRLAFLVAAGVAFGIVANWPLLREAAHGALPFVPLARFRFVLCWTGAVCTAMLIDLGRHGRQRAALAGVTVAGAALLWLFAQWDFPDASRRRASLREARPSIAVLLLAALLVVARLRRFVLPLLALAIAVEMTSVNRNWNPELPASAFYPRTPIIDALERLSGDGSRIIGIGESLYPNSSAMFGFTDVRSHDPMENGRYEALIARVTRGYDTKNYYAKWYDAETRLIDYLNARWVVTAPGVDLHDGRRYHLIYDGHDGRIFDNRDVLPRAFAVRNVLVGLPPAEHNDWRNTAYLEFLPTRDKRVHDDLFKPRPPTAPMAHAESAGSTIRYDAPRHTLVVTSIAWYPGWRTSAGRIVRVNDGFIGIVVPPGHGRVVLRYAPTTFWGGVIAAVLTLLALAWKSRLAGNHLRSRSC